MAPPGWASDAQTAFLTSLIPEYEKCQVDRHYKPFWTSLYSRYLTHSPLINDIFPGRTIQDLNETELAVYTKALEKLQTRLREWYRWRCNIRSRRLAVSIPKRILKSIYSPHTRGLKAYEAYSKLYPEEVKAVLDARCEEEGIKGKRKLQFWHIVCKDLYATASDEQLKAIDDYVEAKNEKDEVDPTDPKRYNKVLPAILKAAVEPAVRKAGLMALITLVGPVPEANGRISAWTLQFGDKDDTPLFSSSWVDHDRVYVEAVARFAKKHVFGSSSTSNDCLVPEKVESRSEDPSSTPPVEDEQVLDAGQLKVPPSSVPNPSSSASNNLPKLSTPAGIDPPNPPSSASLDRPLPPPTGNDLPLPCSPAMSDLGSDFEDLDPPPDRGPRLRLSTPRPLPHNLPIRPAGLIVSPPRDEHILARENNLSSVSFDGFEGFGGGDLITMDDFSSTFQQTATYGPRKSFSGSVRNDWETSKARYGWESFLERNPTYGRSPVRATPSPDEAAPLEAQTIFAPSTKQQLTSSDNAAPSDFPSSWTNPPRIPLYGRGQDISASALTGVAYGHGLPEDGPFIATQPVELPRSGFSPAPSITGLGPRPERVSPVIPGGPPNSPRTTPVVIKAGSHVASELLGGSVAPPTAPNGAQLLLNPPIANAPIACPPIANPPIVQPVPNVESSPPQPISPAGVKSAHIHTTEVPCVSTSTVSTTPAAAATVSTAHAAASSISTAHAAAATVSTACSAASSVPTTHPAASTVSTAHPASAAASVATAAASATTKPVADVPPPDLASQRSNPAPVDDHESAPSGVRRSGRGMIPSKMRERLQHIGSNIPLFSRPVDKDSNDPLTPPPWFTSATADLRDPKLGGEWVALIDKWANMERSLGYGKMLKGAMPVKGRPEEWSKWTNKSAHGARNHSRPPFIDDPAEIGISITKWWKAMKPSLSTSEGQTDDTPTACDDTWASIKKSGPNGTISLLMLMLWWGRAAALGPDSFREDSREQWKALVADVSACFDVLTSTTPSRGEKRGPDENTAPSTPGSLKKARQS
ncbi:hypothetical protein DFP72DRAFT_1072211 [Ephemerocybe angulata]|uniref:Uncharacterized protein n=1 Tax=Ephemerocybe angulata TaxID=980116 RepID=A0A8H6M138_9AGAR|nr:hypothetical protein DFP72DRAFT_1072211 [Tulosesus angulatus]